MKLASAGAAVAGFGIVAVLARSAHPGGGGASAAGTPAAGGGLDVSSRISQEAQSDPFFDSGSVAPSQSSSPPQASTHTS